MPFRKTRPRNQLPPAGTPIDMSDPLARGMIVCWLMNEGAATNLYDSSGYGNKAVNVAYGTLIPPAWSPGLLGQTVDTTGASSGSPCILAGAAVPMSFTSSDFTLSIRVNYQVISASPVILFKGPFITSGYYSQISSNGTVNLALNNGATAKTNSTGAGMIVIGLWQHIVFVRQGTVVKIYINGVDQTATSVAVVDPVSNTGQAFWVGGYNGSDGLPTRGKMSDFRAFNRALPASEVRALYENPTRPFVMPRRRIISGSGTAEVITVDKWFQPASQPLITRPELIPY